MNSTDLWTRAQGSALPVRWSPALEGAPRKKDTMFNNIRSDLAA
jgi:hypothetical protein